MYKSTNLPRHIFKWCYSRVHQVTSFFSWCNSLLKRMFHQKIALLLFFVEFQIILGIRNMWIGRKIYTNNSHFAHSNKINLVKRMSAVRIIFKQIMSIIRFGSIQFMRQRKWWKINGSGYYILLNACQNLFLPDIMCLSNIRKLWP